MSMGGGPTFGWTYTCNASPALNQIAATKQAAQQLHAVVAQGQQVFQSYGGSAVQASKHIDVLGTSTMNSSKHVQALMGYMTQFVGTAAALGLISKAFGAMGESIKQAREHGEETGKSSLSQREKARELANLMGEPEPNDRVMSRIFQTSMASGMKFDDAVKHLEGFYSATFAGLKKGNVRQDQLPELGTVVARMAVRFGMESKVSGDIAGAILQHVDINKQTDANGKLMTANEALAAQFESMAQAANEGRGKISTIMRAEMSQAAAALGAGRIKGLPEMSGYTSVASTLSKSGAFSGTFFQQFDNALNHAGDKFGKFLDEIGVGAEHGDTAKFKKLREHIEQARPEDVNRYLADHGLGSQQERRAIVGMLSNVDVFEKGKAAAEVRAREGKESLERTSQFERSLASQDMRAEAKIGAAEFETGDRHAPLMVARKNALARLEHQGLLHDENQVKAQKLLHLFNNDNWTGAPDEIKRMIDEEVARDVERKIPEAQARGLTSDIRYGTAVNHGLGATDTEQVENFRRAMEINPGILGDDNDAGIGVTMKAGDRHDAKGNPIAAPTPWRGNPAAAGLPARRGPIPRQHEPPGTAESPIPPGGGLGPDGAPQAALDAHDLKGAAAALKQAAGAIVASTRAGQDMMPDFNGGGYDQYRA